MQPLSGKNQRKTNIFQGPGKVREFSAHAPEAERNKKQNGFVGEVECLAHKVP